MDCRDNKIKDKYYEKFAFLFDHVIAIKDAELNGKHAL
jgi:hypothetical protein